MRLMKFSLKRTAKRAVVGVFATGAFALLGVSTGQAASVLTKWDLFSHPFGNQAPPVYGLRLDGLLDGNTNREWTFDFNRLGEGALTMTLFDDASLRIQGRVYGGEDAQSSTQSYVTGTEGEWYLDFTYRDNVTFEPAGSGTNNVPVRVTDETGGTLIRPGTDSQAQVDDLNNKNVLGVRGNNGIFAPLFDISETSEIESVNSVSADLSSISITYAINLIDEAGNNGFSFLYADDSHRCGSDTDCQSRSVGRGWLNHSETYGAAVSDDAHIYSSDFLFTGQVSAVPLPAAAPLLAGAIAVFGIFGVRRRRRMSA